MSNIKHLLGLQPHSPRLTEFLFSISQPVVPEVKSYPDAVYFNYFSLGLSILFSPKGGYKPTTGLNLSDLKNDSLVLDSIYIYNVPKQTENRTKGTSSYAAEMAFSTFPISPLILTIETVAHDKDGKEISRPPNLKVHRDTTGKDFVQALGEPDRKGGGTGPSSGSIGIWYRNTLVSIDILSYPPPAMSVPSDFNVLDISGKFLMNKTLSDQRTDTILQLQGVGWLKRKAISIGSVTLAIKHYKDADSVEHIDIEQTLTGGIPGTTEIRTLWWKERESEDHLFGHVIGKSRRVKAEELDVPFLQAPWTEDTLQQGLIQSYVESDTPKSGNTWIANQTWGIEEIGGERRYVRHVKFTGPKAEDIEAKLVYDYRSFYSSNYDESYSFLNSNSWSFITVYLLSILTYT
ncbi:hypothetical protein CVT25_005675 [Psilocybe cyanescens]|uniref:Uncharacterized protein n=1 Tax=Psilocybe cyanescens TaxID=93625 RepID=A0A409VLC6_PSICY|nr:hypothetical protein CVT25_005675 [Psilocybe cyanescens]